MHKTDLSEPSNLNILDLSMISWVTWTHTKKKQQRLKVYFLSTWCDLKTHDTDTIVRLYKPHCLWNSSLACHACEKPAHCLGESLGKTAKYIFQCFIQFKWVHILITLSLALAVLESFTKPFQLTIIIYQVIAVYNHYLPSFCSLVIISQAFAFSHYLTSFCGLQLFTYIHYWKYCKLVYLRNLLYSQSEVLPADVCSTLVSRSNLQLSHILQKLRKKIITIFCNKKCGQLVS